jgi:hypothetical protein
LPLTKLGTEALQVSDPFIGQLKALLMDGILETQKSFMTWQKTMW